MKCKDIEQAIYLYRDGELSAEEEQQLFCHLNTCVSCKQLYEELNQVYERFRIQAIESTSKSFQAEPFINRELKARRYIQPIRIGLAASIALLFGLYVFETMHTKQQEFIVQQQFRKPNENKKSVHVITTNALLALQKSTKSECVDFYKRLKIKPNRSIQLLSLNQSDMAVLENCLSENQVF